MKPKLEDRFRKVLAARRDDLIREIHACWERMSMEPASDPMDRVRNIADRDFTVRGVDRRFGILRMVEGALRKIRDGTFGTCAGCGAEIPVTRLEAVPWSPYCVSCQERAERSELSEEEAEYALAS